MSNAVENNGAVVAAGGAKTEETEKNVDLPPHPMSVSTALVQLSFPDGGVVEVEECLLYQCGLFRTMYDDAGFTNLASSGKLEMAMAQKTFEKIVEWMEAHRGVPTPKIKEEPLTRERIWFVFDEFQKKFFDVSWDELEAIVKAANFLDHTMLYTYSCQQIASLIKKADTPEKIRELLGLEDDLTAEEKAEIERNNVWCKY